MIFSLGETKYIEENIENLIKLGIPEKQISLIQKRINKFYKRMSKEDKSLLYNELINIIIEVKRGERQGGHFNLHLFKITPPGLNFNGIILEGDAQVLNAYLHQGGRGTERYIFTNEGDILGIAFHARGDSTNLRWRIKFF